MNFKKIVSAVSALAISVSAFAGLAVTANAADVDVAPTAVTTIHAAGSDSTKGYADTNYYDATATSWRVTQSSYSKGAFADGQSKYDGSYLLISKFDVSDYDINEATLSFDAQCTVAGKNSNIYVATINTNWDPATATWNTVYNTLSPSKFGETGSVDTTKVNKTFDVTDKISNGALGIAIYTYTAREQEISNLKLILDYTPAAADAATVTLNILDEEQNQIADPVTVNNLVVGEAFDPSEYAPATITQDLTDENGTYHQDYAYSSADSIESLEATNTVDVTYAASGDPYVYITWNKGTSSTNQFTEYQDVTKVTKGVTNYRYNLQQYLNHDGVVYKYSGNGGAYKTNADKDKTLSLSYAAVENGEFFAEGEDIAWSGGTVTENNATCSNGSAKRAYKDVYAYTNGWTAPQSGTYKVTINARNQRSAASAYGYVFAEKVGNTLTDLGDTPLWQNSSSYSVQEATVHLNAGSELALRETTGYNSNVYIDYVLITFVAGDPSVSATSAVKEGYITFKGEIANAATVDRAGFGFVNLSDAVGSTALQALWTTNAVQNNTFGAAIEQQKGATHSAFYAVPYIVVNGNAVFGSVVASEWN